MTDTQLQLKELKSFANIPVCGQTIRRRLREAGIRKWRALKRPLLTKEYAKKRLNWAREHQRWIEQWGKVIWSDESAIQKDSDPRTLWV